MGRGQYVYLTLKYNRIQFLQDILRYSMLKNVPNNLYRENRLHWFLISLRLYGVTTYTLNVYSNELDTLFRTPAKAKFM